MVMLIVVRIVLECPRIKFVDVVRCVGWRDAQQLELWALFIAVRVGKNDEDDA